MSSETTQIFIDLIARDKASRTLLRSAVALSAVGLAAVRFAKDSVKAFSESEDAQNRLDFAYAKFPKLADVSLQSLSDLAIAMQRKTKFDDESLKTGEAVLAQFNLTGKQVEQVLPLIADYAAATGKAIPEASTLVGKALLGNARALKEMGINFKATGDTGKDFAKIQQLISDKVGGFAENQGKTAAGQAEILKNQYNELQEVVGHALLPALTSLVQIITPIIEAFVALPGPVQEVILGFTALAVVTGVVVPRLAAVKEGFIALRGASVAAAEGEAIAGAASSALLGPIGLVVGAITLASAAALLFIGRTKAEVQPLGAVADALRLSRKAYLDEIRAKQLDAVLTSDNIKLLQQSGVSIDLVRAALDGNASALQVVNQQLGIAIDRNTRVVNAVDAHGRATRQTEKVLNDTARSIRDNLLPQFSGLTAQVRADAAQWDYLHGAAARAGAAMARAVAAGQNAHLQSQFSNPPRTAAGGIFTSPQVRLIAEAGPEAVIPLGNGKLHVQSGGSTVTNYINVYTQANEHDVIRVIQKYSRANGKGWQG